MDRSDEHDGVVVSRRDGLRRAAVIGVGAAVAAMRPGFVAGQAATPDIGAVPPVIAEWIAAYQRRDAAAMAALYAPDAVYEDVPNNFAAHGDQIAGFLATAEQGFSEVRIDVANAFAGDGWAVVEYQFHATNAGMIPDPAAAGKSFTSRAVTVFELAGDKIARSSDYYDLMTILAQLGLLPAMPAPGATPAP